MQRGDYVRYRTFCVLLASTLMLAGAAIGLWRGEAEKPIEAETADASSGALAGQTWRRPVGGAVREAFGAQYSEELGQWTMRECMVLQTENREPVVAPLDGSVEKVAAQTGGGSRIDMRCGDMQVSLSPVYGVRVFEGSAVQSGDVLGEAEGTLSVCAKRAGVCVDPEAGE